MHLVDFLGDSVVKNAPTMQEMQVQSTGLKIPWRRTWQPTPIFLPGKSHGQRSLVGYSSWDYKESDTTWWLNSNLILRRLIKIKIQLWNWSPKKWVVSGNISSVQFSSVAPNSLQPHELQHARPPCPSPAPGVHPNSCPSSWWCHPAISSSVVPFSSCPQSLPASESFPMSQLFSWGGQNIGFSFSIIPSKEHPGLISLQSKGLSRIFSNTTVQKHESFSAQLSSQSNCHIHTWLLEKP